MKTPDSLWKDLTESERNAGCSRQKGSDSTRIKEDIPIDICTEIENGKKLGQPVIANREKNILSVSADKARFVVDAETNDANDANDVEGESKECECCLLRCGEAVAREDWDREARLDDVL
ncbi:hypothetical protein SERLA73DRAFT_75644 [Serpula lacrymans var. lacrymans S7.3]|uniref:Uncharacterized protein n=2 Tax=Serpula lacrymans var. lacrymans TaxID=341189 RepID=F8Q3S8_SERL3|nr:uncharacterized protein SERLADRAFT_409900 [Serpula lacrymans var. lacrymans S7.9]EGN96784.1 hypothetical protein SERLA73DRAFT_75644 [Serpula lacrymans var. lacrymans S7.3]EGO22384.1 hypothetical protein SERLADRAFT_409900 [Serpula lacrymans var. lacrymans S7.9]